MNIKLNAVRRPIGIPRLLVAVSPGQTDMGAGQVTVFLSAVDNFDVPTVVASLRLSPDEARDLAARLLDAADKAVQS